MRRIGETHAKTYVSLRKNLRNPRKNLRNSRKNLRNQRKTYATYAIFGEKTFTYTPHSAVIDVSAFEIDQNCRFS